MGAFEEPLLTPSAGRVARRKVAEMSHAASVALMKWLAATTRRMGVAKHVYVVGGAVRNFIIDQPIKDIDMVVDSLALRGDRDAAWVAQQIARRIPTMTDIVTDNLMVSKVFIKGPWELDGHQLEGEVIEIVNARAEEYEVDPLTGEPLGHKPLKVAPTTLEVDVTRREFTFNCMAGDTLIPTEQGILRIDQIVAREDGDHQEINLTVAGQAGPSTAVGWQYSGYAPTLRVTTEWGHSFACTHHHPVLVLRGHDHKWVQADQLEEGDLLCVPVRQVTRQKTLVLNLSDPPKPKHGRLKKARKPEEMTPELAFVLGCIVAEGSNTHKRVSFSNSDPNLISRYVECFHAAFGFQPSRNKVVEKGSVRILRGVGFVANADGYDIYADSKAVVGWLEDLGLYCGGSKDGKSASHHKVVPWSILQADERSQWAFIAAYLEGDGSIRPDTGRITFCSASPHIRQQLQVLLGAHGILSKVADRFVYINAVDSAFLWEKIQPWMVVKGFDYTQRDNKARNRYGIPAEYIRGFLAGRKQDPARSVYATDGDGFRALPDVHEPLRKVQRLLHDAYARGDFDGFMASLKIISPVEHTKLQRLFDLGYQYVEVTSVEDAGEQDVFDISMGEGVEPAFVANGVVVHNTLMWRLLDLANGPEKAEIIDLTGCGVRDLEDKVMRCPRPADETFAEDPTRIIRTIKFAFKYGFKLPPDVKAAAKRQAKGLKRIPAKAWGALRDIVLENPQYKKALGVMDDLGVTDVLAEMVQEDQQFRKTLANYAQNRGVAFMFDLMDLGVPVGTPMAFLGPAKERFRQRTLGMDRDEALAYLSVLENPGRAYKDKKFVPSLARQYDIPPKDMRNFMPLVTSLARDLLLDDPSLVDDSSRLKRELQRGLDASPPRLASAWGVTLCPR